MNFEASLLPRFLPDYYKRLFPFKPFCKWLAYGEGSFAYFSKREFGFILDGDIHSRYRSYANALEFEQDLTKSCPVQLDIGAVFNYKPKDNKKYFDFHAIERELVFDIDLTDYDDIRTCCTEAKVCRKCWRWITIAVKVLDQLLKEHFGFEHRLWVFSGRRGVHCWVGDPVARKLSNVGRSAVAEYLSLVVGGHKTVNIVTKKKYVHPMIDEAYQIIMESGEMDEMVLEQGWFNDGCDALLEGCTEPTLVAELSAVVTDVMCAKPTERWNALRMKFDELRRTELQSAGVDLCEAASFEACAHFRGFVLRYAYPRLDVNVSTGLNHLLKSPFCVHPKTGRVAVPITADQVDHIDIDSLPRIDALLNELANISRDKENAGSQKALDYKRTSLGPFVEVFEEFVRNLLENCAADDDDEQKESSSMEQSS